MHPHVVEHKCVFVLVRCACMYARKQARSQTLTHPHLLKFITQVHTDVWVWPNTRYEHMYSCI